MRTLRFLLPILLLAGVLAAQTEPAKPARPDGLYGTIQTSMGSLVVKFYETESPITVKNFVDLALGRKMWTDPKTGTRVKRPLYNGLIFHRVIPNFMIQGGDPTGTGMGGTDVIKDEFHPTLKLDKPGVMAMANAGPNTGSCQFFITEVPTQYLNGKHTIFGQVVENVELVGKITRVPRNAQDKPTTPVVIQKMTFERVGAVPPGGIVLAATPAAKPAAGAAAKAPAKAAPAKAAPAKSAAPAK
jgi:peptidyl-prolyl cis-trans isomerase A (cyclophilin A)